MILLIIVIPRFFVDNIQNGSVDELYKIEVQKFVQEIKNDSAEYASTKYSSFSPKRTHRLNPHKFNPNSATLQEYVDMGFSERQAASMIKYRDNGGHFESKEDFNKLFVIDDQTYQIFQPFIDLPNQKDITSGGQKAVNPDRNINKDNNAKYPGSRTVPNVELNSADSLELLKINGVGPVFASRILKYRGKIGGFVTVYQLRDVYGIDSVRFSSIKPQVRVDTSLIVKLKINKVDLQVLKRHPYFDYYLAKAVIDRRIQKKGIRNADEIRDLFRNKKVVFENLIPYLDFSY